MNWTWSPDGRSVVVEGQKYEIDPSKLDESYEFSMRWEEARWVFGKLSSAEASIASGAAEYEDAARRLKDLRRELYTASAEMRATASGISALFAPEGLTGRFKDDDGSALARFILEALDRFGAAMAAEVAPPAEAPGPAAPSHVKIPTKAARKPRGKR